MWLWFAPACLHIPARDNSVVSRSGRRRYRIRKLVWSCRNHSRNSFICSYHAVLQCGFPNAAVPPRPGQGKGSQRGSRDSGTAALPRNLPGYPPCTDGHFWLPQGPHKSVEGREKVPGETCAFVAVSPRLAATWRMGPAASPLQAVLHADAAPGRVVNHRGGRSD